MPSAMSWDPSAALRDAMEEQLTHLRRTLSAVTPGDEHAEEMQRRLQTQIDDIEGRILKMNRPTGASSSDDVEHQQKVIPNRPPTLSTATEKSDIRAKVWTELRKVALPDSRFHYDFAEFIADFQGSSEATTRFTALPCYSNASFVFITPDNCLEELRLQSLNDGKTILITTYSIRRGFWILDPAKIPQTRYEYACTLDGMEKVGQAVTLSELLKLQPKIDLMVTGTGAINTKGIRYGKGHGFFDLEWGMLFTLGLVDTSTVTAALVHDCQLLQEELHPMEFDTVCDVVVTPSKVIHVEGAQKPKCGIIWDKLESNMLQDIPPLQELQTMISTGAAKQP